MPVRITCPSCSSTLSVRDEFAGRAVKCPKCAGIIPPQEAPSTVSEPEAVATLPPPPEPEPQRPVKTGSKVTGRPTARSKDDHEEDERPRKKRRDEDEDERDEERPKKREEDDRDEEPRPKKRRNDEEERDEQPRERKRRDEDEDERDERERPRDRDRDDRGRHRAAADDRDDDYDDRPARRRRRDDDYDDDDDRPRGRNRDKDDGPAHRRYQQGGSNTGLIVAGAAILLCLVAVIAGYFVYSAREADNRAVLDAERAEREKAEKERTAPGVTAGNFDKVKLGDSRTQAEAALGKGRVATVEDLSKVFRSAADKRRSADWTAKVQEGRAVIWQSAEDSFALVMFHPNPEAGGRVQAKVWRTKSGGSSSEGDLDDAAFLKRFPSKEPGEAKVNPPKGGSP